MSSDSRPTAPQRTGPLSGWLQATDVCWVHEFDRPTSDNQPPATWEPSAGELGGRLRYAATVAAYHMTLMSRQHTPDPLLVGWLRRQATGPVEVFAGGAVPARSAAGGHTIVVLPPGARGRRSGAGALAEALRPLRSWTRIAGITDGLLMEPDQPETARVEISRPSLDECLLRVWQEPFAWLVLAEPLSPDKVAEQAAEVAQRERDARSRASSPEHAVRALRWGLRHRELRRAESDGLWRVHLLAGGIDPSSAAVIAGLLCASADIGRLPYALAPTGAVSELVPLLDSPSIANSPFLASSQLVAALATGPQEEMPGVRLTRRPDFDVTPETASSAEPQMPLGRIVDHNGIEVLDFPVPHSSLNRHTFVCGSTGAGKSQTVRHLLEQASAAGINWLVVEPAKAEYRRMADRLGPNRVVCIRPGDPAAPPVGLNPLEPAPGFALQTHADLVRALFLAAFEAEEPFPQVLASSLTRCYEELGWDLTTGRPAGRGHRPRYPRLGDLQRVADRVVTDIGYGREVSDNVRGFIKVRLASLRLGTTGRFFESGHPLDVPTLMRHNVVFEIEDVGDDRDKAFLMGTVLIRLVEHLRTAVGSAAELRHLSVFEEAHRLLRRTDRPGPAAHAVELFAAMLAEIRAYGEGIVIAEQIPSKLIPDVIKNTAVKVIHRLPARDDRDAVGATINLSESQSEQVVAFPPGTAAVFSDGMDGPVMVRMPDGTDRECGLVAASDAHRLAGRRSATCGVQCRETPCTLVEMADTRLLLADPDGLLRIWAQLAVVAHLTGWPHPIPTAQERAAFREWSRRRISCAVSHAVDDAVAARTTALVGIADPNGLAVHVANVMTGQRCGRRERQWLARPYRWVFLREELARPGPGLHPDRQRHPRSDEWAVIYGREIPGATIEAQYAAVDGWYHADQLPAAARWQVIYGTGEPSDLEVAVGHRRESEEWAVAVPALLNRFQSCRWPLRYLLRKG